MKIFLVGDSISVHYRPYLQTQLEGVMEIAHRKGEESALLNLDTPRGANCGDSGMVLAYLQAKIATGGIDADLVLVNCGLHDIKTDPASGERQIPLEQYEDNLRRLVRLQRKMGSKLVWIRTTPCDETVHNREGMEFHRYSADCMAYNQAADRIMQGAGVPIIDLHTFTRNLGPDLYCDHVHFHPEIREKQAAFIAGSVMALSGDKCLPTPWPAPTLDDVAYGPHERHRLTFWQAKTDAPSPVLFWIHGGGWNNGSRHISAREMLHPMLENGISVVTIDYRFVGHAHDDGLYPPVKGPLYDAARALQFVRSKAAEWHIDPNRIAASGGSAGACSSLWLAFHDDLADPESDDPVARESTRLQAVAVLAAQTSLDPHQMREWTPNSIYGGHAFAAVKPLVEPPSMHPHKWAPDFDSFHARRDELLPLIKEYSPYSLATAAAPPVYLHYYTPPAPGKEEEDPTHTANFGVMLKQRLDELKVPCELVYPGAPEVKHGYITSFLIEVLKS